MEPVSSLVKTVCGKKPPTPCPVNLTETESRPLLSDIRKG
jgi:hypothetical protein